MVATSTGSPASRKFTKLTPLTTRPSLTSRQGIMRLVNMRTRETSNVKRETKMSAKNSSRLALTQYQEPQERPDNLIYRRRGPSLQLHLQPVDRAPARLASPRGAKSRLKRSQGRTTTQPPLATPLDSARPTFHRGRCPYRSQRPRHSLLAPSAIQSPSSPIPPS